MPDQDALPTALEELGLDAIELYSKVLNELEEQDVPTMEQILAVMVARDSIQYFLKNPVELANLAKIINLDEKLLTQAEKLEQLANYRKSIQPPESHWWWFLDVNPLDQLSQLGNQATNVTNIKKRWLRWDWLWNLGTVTCLVISTGLITQTAKAFSEEGFDLLGTISTISQGAGLAFVAGGALTDQGKERVKKVLNDLHIPSQLHAEATFAGSVILLTVSFGLHNNLPILGNQYYRWGQQQESRQNWKEALANYHRAAQFNPANSLVTLSEGELHEKLGNFEEAISIYDTGARLGNPHFSNALARAMLMQSLQQQNWQAPLDSSTLAEVDFLLSRGWHSLPEGTQNRVKDKENYLLMLDLGVNQIIYEIARVDWDRLNILNEEKTVDPYEWLYEVAPVLGTPLEEARKFEGKLPFDLRKLDRTACYYYTLISLFQRHFFQLSNEALILDTNFRFGDASIYAVNKEYVCASITGYSSEPEFLNDRQFLNGLARTLNLAEPQIRQKLIRNRELDSWFLREELVESISLRGYNENHTLSMVSDAALWQQLQLKLKTELQANFQAIIKGNQAFEDEMGVWRVLMTSEGQVICYLAYGSFSQSFMRESPIIKQWDSNIEKLLADNTRDSLITWFEDQEFVDFKVIFHPTQQQIIILDWQSVYPGAFPNFDQPLTDLPPINYSEETLSNQAEIEVLSSILYHRLKGFNFLNDNFTRAKQPNPWIYQITIGVNGQIVDYEPIDNRAAENVYRTPLSQISLEPFDDRVPTEKFKVSFKDSFTYQVESVME